MSSDRIDERTERLIVRLLDGESSPEEAAELRSLVIQDASARALYEEYVRMDAAAKAALSQVLVKPVTAAATPRSRRGLWLAAAAGVMSAAAVIGFAIFPYRPNAGVPMANNNGVTNALPLGVGRSPNIAPTLAADEYVNGPRAWRQLSPYRNEVNIHRDWVGVLDDKTQQVYFISVDRRDTKQIPVFVEH